MKCFRHHERDAVGVCRSCYKGLCPDCAVEVDKSLACRNSCEEDVRAVNLLIAENIKITPIASKILHRRENIVKGANIFNVTFGGIFILIGLADPSRFLILIFLGAFLLIYGIYSHVQRQRNEQNAKR